MATLPGWLSGIPSAILSPIFGVWLTPASALWSEIRPFFDLLFTPIVNALADAGRKGLAAGKELQAVEDWVAAVERTAPDATSVSQAFADLKAETEWQRQLLNYHMASLNKYNQWVARARYGQVPFMIQRDDLEVGVEEVQALSGMGALGIAPIIIAIGAAVLAIVAAIAAIVNWSTAAKRDLNAMAKDLADAYLAAGKPDMAQKVLEAAASAGKKGPLAELATVLGIAALGVAAVMLIPRIWPEKKTGG